MPKAPGHTITVVLVDDHILVRDGVREILEAEEDITVVAEAVDGQAAVPLAARHRPDVVLLDADPPGREAAETVHRIRSLSPGTQVIVLTAHDEPQLLRRLISAGVCGFLLKSVHRGQLVCAVRSVHRGADRMVLSVSRESLAHLHSAVGEICSERELEVLRLVALAFSNGQIASRLDITEATVKRHLRKIFLKLGAVSRIDAVNKAVRAHLLPSPGGAPGQRTVRYRPRRHIV